MAKRVVAWYCVFVMLVIALAPRVEAAFVGSADVLAAPERASLDAERIAALLAKKEIEVRLLDLGFRSSEVEKRLSGLSDSQVLELAARLDDDVKVGGQAEGVLIGVLVILLVVGLILPLFGIRIWK